MKPAATATAAAVLTCLAFAAVARHAGAADPVEAPAAAAAAAAAAFAAQALDAADQVADVPRRLAVYRDLIPVLGRARDRGGVARAAAAGMRLARERGDRVAQAEVSAAAALAFAQVGDRDAHDRWLNEAFSVGAFADRPVAWPALARARLAGGDPDGAAKLAVGLGTAKDRAACLADLALISAKAGDREICFDFLRMAMVNARAVDRPDAAQEAIARAQAQLGDRDGAAQTAAAIPHGFHRARALAAVAQAAARGGDARAYRELVDAAAGTALQAPTPTERAAAVLSVARAQAEAGDRPGATATLATLDKALKGGDPARAAGVYLALAGVRMQIGDAAGASDARTKAAQMFKGLRAAMAADDAVASQVTAGDPAGASAAAMMIDDPAVRARAMNRVAEGHAAAGQLAELAALARQLDADAWPSARTIGRAFAAAGKADDAQAMAAAQQDPAARSGLYAGIAEGVAERAK